MRLRIQTARKDHVCDLCQKKIPEGHRYWLRKVKDHGVLLYEREHTNCEEYQGAYVRT